MLVKQKPLGLILGSGPLTNTLIKNCNKNKIETIIIGIGDENNNYITKANITISFNNLCSIFSYLKKKNIEQVVFIGSIKKKKIISIKHKHKNLKKKIIIIINKKINKIK